MSDKNLSELLEQLHTELTNTEAIDFLDSVYADPAVAFAEEPAAVRPLWHELARGSHPAPLVWMDAYLAALAITIEAEVVTFDRGFLSYRRAGLAVTLLAA